MWGEGGWSEHKGSLDLLLPAYALSDIQAAACTRPPAGGGEGGDDVWKQMSSGRNAAGLQPCHMVCCLFCWPELFEWGQGKGGWGVDDAHIESLVCLNRTHEHAQDQAANCLPIMHLQDNPPHQGLQSYIVMTIPEACRIIARHGWLFALLGRAPMQACSVTSGGMPDLLRGKGAASVARLLISGLRGAGASASN